MPTPASQVLQPCQPHFYTAQTGAGAWSAATDSTDAAGISPVTFAAVLGCIVTLTLLSTACRAFGSGIAVTVFRCLVQG